MTDRVWVSMPTVASGMQQLVAVVGFAAVLAAVDTAWATPINIDFSRGTNPAPSNAFGAAAGQVGAWNNVVLPNPPVSLFDLAGNGTGASITDTADTLGISGAAGGSVDAMNLMRDGFLSNSGASWTFVVTGLSNGIYDIYLYQISTTTIGTGSGTVNGVAFSNINGGFASGTFTQGSN